MTKAWRFDRDTLGHSIALWGGMCLLIVLMAACKKDEVDAPYPPDELISPTTGTRKQLTLDSVYLYARQLYLWDDVLPTYEVFAPRDRFGGITPEQTAYERELYALSQYAIRSDGQPYEWSSTEYKARYSYLEPYSGNAGQMAATPRLATYATHLNYWTAGDRIVAYLYIASFPALGQVQAELDAVFAELAERQVTHLIIDLRHNGGGYVKTAEYLANLIAPSSLAAKVMFSEHFNSRVQGGRATILQYQPYLDADGKAVPYKGRNATMADVDYSIAANTRKFEKKGSLQSIQQLSFMVSHRTASAAELLISTFKPHLPVRIIGQRTYGKPVGFVPIRIDRYQVYLTGFLIRNADGWSDYFDGMDVDVATPDGGNLPIGDPAEPSLAAALRDIDPALLPSGKRASTLRATAAADAAVRPFATGASPVPILKQGFTLR